MFVSFNFDYIIISYCLYRHVQINQSFKTKNKNKWITEEFMVLQDSTKKS